MELIKLFTHACTVDGMMELAGSTDYLIYIANTFSYFLQDWFSFATIRFLNFIVRCCIYLTNYDWINSFLKITIVGRAISR